MIIVQFFLIKQTDQIWLNKNCVRFKLAKVKSRTVRWKHVSLKNELKKYYSFLN